MDEECYDCQNSIGFVSHRDDQGNPLCNFCHDSFIEKKNEESFERMKEEDLW